MTDHTNASTSHTTAHVDANGVKRYGIDARLTADREAAANLDTTDGRAAAITTPDGIAGASLLALRSAVKLQARGITRRPSPLSIAKRYGYRGTAATVAAALDLDCQRHADYFDFVHAGYAAINPAGALLRWYEITDAGRRYLLDRRHPDPDPGGTPAL